jgi:phage protein D
MTGNNGNLVPAYLVKINGSELPPEAVADLVEVTVFEDLRAPGMFTLKMNNWNMAELTVTWVDDDLYTEGGEVEIQMGYVGVLETLFKGEITGLEPGFTSDEAPSLTVRGFDQQHRLLRGRKTRCFNEVKDSDIASQIASDLGLTAETEDTGITYPSVLQHNRSDLDFLQDRARRIGYEVVVEDKTLYFRPFQNTEDGVLTLKRDEDLIEFHPRLSTLQQISEVAVRGWDPKAKEAITGKAAAGDELSKMGGSTAGSEASDQAFGAADLAAIDHPVFSQTEAEQIALGNLNDLSLGFVSGDGVCIGRTDLRAGTVIEIEGVGERFSGQYYVTSTTHVYRPGQGYETYFSIRRNAT